MKTIDDIYRKYWEEELGGPDVTVKQLQDTHASNDDEREGNTNGMD